MGLGWGEGWIYAATADQPREEWGQEFGSAYAGVCEGRGVADGDSWPLLVSRRKRGVRAHCCFYGTEDGPRCFVRFCGRGRRQCRSRGSKEAGDEARERRKNKDEVKKPYKRSL